MGAEAKLIAGPAKAGDIAARLRRVIKKIFFMGLKE
jgi:hypothetical protein